jgi:hypothetical protein
VVTTAAGRMISAENQSIGVGMLLRDDPSPDREIRAAHFSGMTVKDFRRRQKLLLEQASNPPVSELKGEAQPITQGQGQ